MRRSNGDEAEMEVTEHGEQAADEESAEESEPAAGKPIYKKPLFVVGAVAVLLVVAVFGWRYWTYSNAHETTDNAFIEGNIVQVSPKVGGYVKKLYIDENQPVKAGDLLAEIEPSDYQIRLDQATANLNTLKARRQAAEADVVLTQRDDQCRSRTIGQRRRAHSRRCQTGGGECQRSASGSGCDERENQSSQRRHRNGDRQRPPERSGRENGSNRSRNAPTKMPAATPNCSKKIRFRGSVTNRRKRSQKRRSRSLKPPANGRRQARRKFANPAPRCFRLKTITGSHSPRFSRRGRIF